MPESAVALNSIERKTLQKGPLKMADLNMEDQKRTKDGKWQT